jgi:hypothetical protein
LLADGRQGDRRWSRDKQQSQAPKPGRDQTPARAHTHTDAHTDTAAASATHLRMHTPCPHSHEMQEGSGSFIALWAGGQHGTMPHAALTPACRHATRPASTVRSASATCSHSTMAFWSAPLRWRVHACVRRVARYTPPAQRVQNTVAVLRVPPSIAPVPVGERRDHWRHPGIC